MVSLIGVCAFQANGQFGYYQDALKYSQTNWLVGSTARMQGLAGTQNSLGGDISSIHSNPAGLGFYNRNAAGLTMGLGFQNSDDSFTGLTTPNFNNTFNISNAGVVMNFNKGRYTEDKFKGGSLGISIARVNDFNRQYRYEGESGTSIVDYLVERANSSSVLNPSVQAYEDNNEFLLAGAYHQFLIDLADYDQFPDYIEEDQGGQAVIVPQDSDGTLEGFSTPFGRTGGSIPYQQENIVETGSQNEISFSWGGNYDDKIYFGAGLGIQTLYNRIEREYIESEFLFGDEIDPWINSITLNEEIVSRGAGINTTFGLIVRPIDFITAGVSYESPTYLTINQESTQDLAASWGDYFYEDFEGNTYDLLDLDPYLSPVILTKYKLKTPAKVNLGASVFVGKNGFLSADLEVVDYANAELQSNDFSPLTANQEIFDNFRSIINYRIGGEYRLDNIRFRGGYSFNPDPRIGGRNNRKFTTFGVGYKTSDFFLDLAVVNAKSKPNYSPYELSQEAQDNGFKNPLVRSKIKNTTIAITAGFNF